MSNKLLVKSLVKFIEDHLSFNDGLATIEKRLAIHTAIKIIEDYE